MTRWVYHFDDSLPEGSDPRGLLGGKGTGLRQMKQAGLAVPPGFTITTQCCAEYFKLGRRWPEGLEAEIQANLSRLESETGRRFGQGERTLLVSVRSGAARSMPGMMDTLLNCGLPPQSPWDALRDGINLVFDSWNNPRAVAYRRRHDIRNLYGTAVNVQMMFPSQVSGIVFTQDPTAPHEQRIVIEAAYGLGESVVSGNVTPDRYLIPRDNLDNVTTRLGHKNSVVRALGDDRAVDPDASCLDRGQLRELCQLCLDVEKHFGHPVDVEFGLADGRFAMLQARAIRGLDVALGVEPARREEIARLQRIAEEQGRRKVWTAHNLGETLPAPTPLTWDIVGDFMRGDGGFGRMYQRLGYRPSRTVRDDGFLELICGRIYADLDRLADLFWEGLPFGYHADGLARDPAILDQAPTKFVADRADGRFLLRVIPTMVAMLRSARITRRMRATVADRFEQEILPEFLRWVEVERNRNLGELDDPGLLDLLRRRIDRTMHRFGPESLLPGLFGSIALRALGSRLEQLMGKAEGAALANTLTSALDGDTTFEQDALLLKVARGEARLEDVLVRFGHRCGGEMELARPRWREDDGLLVQTIERLAAGATDPQVMHRENAAKREAAEAALPATLARFGGSCFLETITKDLGQARRLLPYRESGKFYLMMGYELIRAVIEELGRRWSLGRDVYFLRREELARFTANEAESHRIIHRRKLKWEALKRLEVGPVVDSNHLDELGLAPELPSVTEHHATEHAATALAAGCASGPARLVFEPNEADDLGTDYVLVCPSTDPGWTPLLIGAVALVVERGGVLSHGAIVARDFGIPAVVLPHATRLIEDGRTIRVDGDTARVSLLESGGPS